MDNVVLASRSPRRKELLLKICPNFIIDVPVMPEVVEGSLAPEETVCALAENKAWEVYKRQSLNFEKNLVVVSADTIVVFYNKILGKPLNADRARETLRMLSGRRHRVITAVCVIKKGRSNCGYKVSFVTFNKLSEKQIEDYIESGLCMDKAGAYGIQDGYNLVKYYRGSYTNIVGLPLKLTAKLMKE